MPARRTYPARPFFDHFPDLLNHETYLPAEQGPTRTDAWLPRPHGHEKWPQGARPATRQGSQAADPIKDSGTAAAPSRFRPEQRLRRPAEFQAAYASGRRFGNELLTATVRPNDGPYARLGLSIAARTVGNSVSRNRLRRLIRESFRLQQWTLPPADFVIGARSAARKASAAVLREGLQRLWTQIIEAWAKR
jgi:ribonuclease P protein component